MSSTCCCSAKIDAQHGMSCNREGLITIRHKDLRDLTANLPSNVCTHKMKSATHKMRKRKKRQYNERVLQVGNGSFIPLVFSIYGGMSREFSTFYNRLSNLLSLKRDMQRLIKKMTGYEQKFCLLY